MVDLDRISAEQDLIHQLKREPSLAEIEAATQAKEDEENSPTTIAKDGGPMVEKPVQRNLLVVTDPDKAEVPLVGAFGSPILPGLSKVGEEMNEWGVVAWKLMMLGGSPHYWNNRHLLEDLEDETADVIASVLYFARLNDLNMDVINLRIEDKTEKYEKWTEQQRLRWFNQQVALKEASRE